MENIELRNLLESQIKEKILGPGFAKEVIVCSNNDVNFEILDSDPTDLYCTGVMLPKETNYFSSDEEDEDTDVYDNETTEDNEENYEVEDETLVSVKSVNDYDKDDKDFVSSNHIGLITCISPECSELDVSIEYAVYKHVSDEDLPSVKIQLGNNVDKFQELLTIIDNDERVNEILQNNQFAQPFSANFNIDENACTASITHNFSLQRLSIQRTLNRAPDHLQDVFKLLQILLRSKFYRREPKRNNITISLNEVNEEFVELSDELEYNFTTFNHTGKKYVKFIVRNKQVSSTSSYKHCVFQAQVTLKPNSGCLVSYSDPITSIENDIENSINEYNYREVINYGKGIGCAVTWEDNGQSISTTYMPVCDVKKFSNEISDTVTNHDTIRRCCILRNISIWSTYSDQEIIGDLRAFVNSYGIWHQNQVVLGQQNPQYQNEAKAILNQQEELRNRLQNNVDYLQNNPEAMRCFKIANTAMLIQMVISRDAHFDKNRNVNTIIEKNIITNDLSYFRNAQYINTMKFRQEEPSYRPFQLAFLLMNITSTIDDNDPNRTEKVDLIWFPTGGGKTEAYLALTALTIVARRRRNYQNPTFAGGVSVIMRYTLRLLTTQQFERASFLICALDFLRQKDAALNLGNEQISIGLWIGKSSSPNTVEEINGINSKYRNFLGGTISGNPFPVAYCPWCGSKLFSTQQKHGYMGDGYLCCINEFCAFHASLPIYYIDQLVYRHKPTLLFATVDKFAQLYNNQPASLFGDGHQVQSPDLIIQDELHLISGPLGSTVGLFETIVEAMASKNGRKPKIIASTATTRNTGELIKQLYGQRQVNIFPAPGLSYTNNYFSHLEDRALRRHVGIMPTGKTTSNETEVRLTASLILARMKLAETYLNDLNVNLNDLDAVNNALINNGHLIDILDNYWSIVLYYNSLKDLGRSSSKVSQEIYENLRHKLVYLQPCETLDFIHQGFNQRKKEFTSREDSSRIKDLLTAAETRTRLSVGNNNKLNAYADSNMDLVFASNMISVGIDIARWNIMVMMGQPRSTSEYIQSSSRVARSYEGIVFNLLNPLRNREYSLFENYISFHSAYYKYVEPLSATPLTIQTLDTKLISNILCCYKRYITNEHNREDILDHLTDLLRQRFNLLDPDLVNYVREKLDEAYDDTDYMQSLRDVDVNYYSMINKLNY